MELFGGMMGKIIYIEASPRKERSASIHSAHLFLEAYQKRHPEDKIHTIDLWERELPPFDGDTINAKYAIIRQREATAEQKKAWKKVEALIDEFKSGDKYVISTPMWNFGIPYRLKHYLDLIIQPGYTFSQDGGLVTGRPAAVFYARGGAYDEGSKVDFQRSYMEHILRYLGFTNIHAVVVQPTIASKEEALAHADEEAHKLLDHF